MSNPLRTNITPLTDYQDSRLLNSNSNNTQQAKRPLPAIPIISSTHPPQSPLPPTQYQIRNPQQSYPISSNSNTSNISSPPTQYQSSSTQYQSSSTQYQSSSTQYQSMLFSPKRTLPILPRPISQPFNQIPFNQTQDVNHNTISNQIIRTGSLQGSRPSLPNLENQLISTYQTLISNPSKKPLPAPPSSIRSNPQPTLINHQSHQELHPVSTKNQSHQELQPVSTHSIKPFTSPSNPMFEPPDISISSVPELTITPTVPLPVLNIVGIDEQSEEESLNQSKSNITLNSTSESNSVSVRIPIIVTEEDKCLKNSESNSSSFNQISIQLPSNPNQTHQPVPISSSSSSLIETNPFQSLFCEGCNQIIAGRIVNALNKRWHPDCFKCEHCQMVLEHVAFYEHLGKPYCGVDYDEFFSLKCHHCNTSITDESYVTLDEPSLINGPRHYHQLHLFCAECGEPFLNPKSLEEFSKISKFKNPQIHQQPKELNQKIIELNPFVLYKGYPYCESCNLKLHKPKCFGCKLSMVGDFINAIGKQWHEDCFVCKGCKNQFLNGMFFLDHGHPFCEQCYSVLLKQTF